MINFIKGLFSKPEPKLSDKEIIMLAISQVGKEMNVDPLLLLSIAKVESNYNPKAKASTSTALGLFQFLNGTWDNLVKSYAKRNGLKDIKREDRTSPRISTIMMCELVKENERYMNSKGLKNLAPVDLYMAHFLGPSKAVKFLSTMGIKPQTLGKDMFPLEAKANKGVYYKKDGTPRTLIEIYEQFKLKLSK